MTTLNLPEDIRPLIDIAIEAGHEIMEVYADVVAARLKPDLSPVTDADLRAEKVIINGLRTHWPEVPIVAEESMAAHNAPKLTQTFFLVDPLDGTREFLAHNGEFTVNISRISGSTPVWGVIYAPALGKIWWGHDEAGAGFAQYAQGDATAALRWTRCKVRTPPASGPIAIASRSHRDSQTEDYLAKIQPSAVTSIGSSLKFCLVAEGKADVYPRFGRTMEWDTAAGHAILTAAGGKVTGLNGQPLVYGKTAVSFENPAFIASA
jgi:3'(2'), 5'-bisphosphate nucleotidase